MRTGYITKLGKEELKGEILTRMNALDTSQEEYTNEQLLRDFAELSNPIIIKRTKYSRGNVAYNREWEFWVVVVLQILCIVTIPFAIHNLYSFIKEKIS